METNRGPRRLAPTVCSLLCSNVRALTGNLSDVASSRYDILLCSETLVSDMLLIRFPCLVVPEHGAEGRQHTYEMDMEHFANQSLTVVVAKCRFLWFVVRDRPYMCSVFTATLT